MVRLERRTLCNLATAATQLYGEKPALALYGEQGLYNSLTYKDFGRKALTFAGFLMKLGLQKGDRVMIIAENRPEWVLAYFGIALAGAVSVPVLTDFLPEHIGTVAAHADIAAVCATEKTLPKLTAAELDKKIPILRLDHMDEEEITVSIEGMNTQLALSEQIQPHSPQEDELASIIYTSGTTGNSKGVMLSHQNIIFDAQACRSIIKIYPRDRFLSVLPLAHTYECTIGMIIAILNGASTSYLDRPPAPAALLPALQAIRPTMMLTVPLIMEKIYRGKIGPALQSHPLYKLSLTRKLAIKAAGKKLMGTFGGAIRFFGIGGAALAPEVEAFLKAADFPYAIGYGLTETAPLLAGAPPFKTVLRSTGPALQGVELRIQDSEGRIVGGVGSPKERVEHAQGEIQARGPNVMLGYYKDPERTAEVFTEDGWFKTGDLGSMDSKGRLFIKGRLKAMILGPSGENIYPEEIENLLNASEVVEESLVYAGDKGELVALIVLNEKARTMLAAAQDALQELGHNAGDVIQGMTQAMGDAAHNAAHDMDAVTQHVKKLIIDLKGATNKRLAIFSRLHRIEIQDEPFEKTATQKIKRFLYPKNSKQADRS